MNMVGLLAAVALVLLCGILLAAVVLAVYVIIRDRDRNRD
jgi:hypothetical protein